MGDPIVSVIIITSNRAFLLAHCINRVLAQPYARKEIIVVDSSSDEESQKVLAQYPDVRCVRLREQRHNMPQARNAGMAISSGDVIAFIDDDSMVQADWLESLVSTFQDETVGAAGGRVIGMPEPYCEQVQGPPRLFVNASGSVVAKDAGLVSVEQVEVDHLIGCNMSFRRKALEQTGGFDPNYTLTNLREETDICVRVKKAGWRIIFTPSIAVLHFSARSLQPYFLERPAVQYSNGRNCTYFAIKHYGLNPRTLFGQLVVDAGRSCGRAAYFAGLFVVGAMAQVAGRIVGLGEGIRWRMSHRRRAASSPAIDAQEHLVSELGTLLASID